MNLSNGVLRQWELRVAQDHASVFVDGEKVYEVNFAKIGVPNLDFSRGYVEWAQFGYNPPKEGFPWVEFKFDNFGFDGPGQPDIGTHSYKSSFNSDDRRYMGTDPPFDAAHGPCSHPHVRWRREAARLMYTIQSPTQWTATDSVTINVRSFRFPSRIH